MYDIVVYEAGDWDKLVRRDLGLVVDPLIYRLGQYFLTGERAAGPESVTRWDAINSDLTSLVTFLDLVVLYDQLPAFNYQDTFAEGSVGVLQNAMNGFGAQILVNVDVEHDLYRQIKHAAMWQLQQRISAGPFISQSVASATLATLDAIKYEWRPDLEVLEQHLPDNDQRRLARYMLGQLIFSGYAQQTGAPHIVSPRRSAFLVSAGLGPEGSHFGSESGMYDELRRRLRDAGDGWRDFAVPWTPSFVPYLLKKANVYREGPDVLLKRAIDLREHPAVQKYRSLRRDLLSHDEFRSKEAKRQLRDAADQVARKLGASKGELEISREMFVEVLPKAVGVVSGAAAGTLVAGPVGTAVGGLAGLVGESALKPVQQKLWGWLLSGLPFRSAGKLLSRAVAAEFDLRKDVGTLLHAAWETGPRGSR
jgi:hypothetical protein